MQKKTSKRGLPYLLGKVIQTGFEDYQGDIIPYERAFAKRLVFVPVGGQVVVTAPDEIEWYDTGEKYSSRGKYVPISKSDLKIDSFVNVGKAQLAKLFREGGATKRITSVQSSDPLLVLERGKTHVAFRAPCGAIGTMTVREADKLAEAIEAL